MCPGGEGAVLKTVGPKGLAGSNPVHGASGKSARKEEEIMKVCNITDIDKFFKVIDSCEGKIELVTEEGDRLNLKSTLSKYVALAKVFSDGTIPSLELVVYEADDIGKLIDYMVYSHAK